MGRLLSWLLDGLLNLGPPALICNAEIFQIKQRVQLCLEKEGSPGKQVGVS